MNLGNVFHNGQSETRSPQLPAAAGIDPIESFENPWQMAGFNSPAVILHFEDHFRRLTADRNPDLFAGIAVLDGIIQKVDKGLMEQATVDIYD
jgi:hypothetical protein